MPNIRKFLDLSTAHLDKPSKVWLENSARSMTSSYQGYFGWFTAAYRDPDNPEHSIVKTGEGDEEATATLVAILEYACANDCDYVLFDADGTVDLALPVFDDEEDPALPEDEETAP